MRLYSRLLCLLGLGLIVALSSVSVFAQGPSADMFANPLIGKPAPDFKLESVKGGTVPLRDIIKGKKAILFFWATWCPHCREQLSALNANKAKIDSEGIVVRLVNVGEDKSKVEKFLKQKGYSFDVLLDVNSEASEIYQVVGSPTLVFIGSDGVIRDIEFGFPDDYEQILK
ncbi:MAG: TlpA family protein disulfide reductase [Candidatus Omnitrophica bacterium]|nr:TlpA family protein disulfide reductase [Candidatus Omnitrophota bacterium]